MPIIYGERFRYNREGVLMNKLPDSSTIIGVGGGFAVLIFGFILEGGTPVALLSLSSLIIILGGTSGAVVASFNVQSLMGIPKSVAGTLKTASGPSQELIIEIISFAEKARREGLLVLEDEVEKLDDPFEQKGIKMMVDGVDPEIIRHTLEKDIEIFEERRKHEAAVFEAAGGYSPTMGIIGTVMGLVLVLGNLGGSASELGHSIAAAFIATLYGICFANVFWLPIGVKIKNNTKSEILRLEMIMVGVLSIQSGDNPSLLKERLSAYLEPEDLKELKNSEANNG